MRNKLLRIHANYQRMSMRNTRNAMNRDGVMQIKDKLRTFCEAIPPNLTAHEKALLLYRVVTQCVHYNHNEGDTNLRFTYAAAMLTGSAVCMGISELLYILYNACDIDCRVVIGCITDSPDYHAWLQVKLPDEYGRMVSYHCDPTWDLNESRYGSYQYYLKSDRYMLSQKHNWLTERYAACPKDYTRYPKLSSQLVARMCEEFKKMYSPNREHFAG